MRIILVSHEKFASETLHTAQAFLGPAENVGVLELQLGDSPEDFETDLRALVEKRAPGEEALILCDLRSGTPFNVASKVSYQDDSISVIYGMNLAMVMEALGVRDDMPLAELTRHIISEMPKTYGIGAF